MHLTTKSLMTLLSPFIVSGGVWFFSDSLVENLALFFEPATQQQTSVLQQQGEAYSFIATHRDEYASLLKKITLRNENRFWISERLYQPYTALTTLSSDTQNTSLQPPPPLLQFGEGNITARRSRSMERSDGTSAAKHGNHQQPHHARWSKDRWGKITQRRILKSIHSNRKGIPMGKIISLISTFFLALIVTGCYTASPPITS